jgi:hypothetical protein
MPLVGLRSRKYVRVLPQEIALRIEISLIEFATIQIADDGLLCGLTIRFDVGEHIVERGLQTRAGTPSVILMSASIASRLPAPVDIYAAGAFPARH